MTQPKWINAKQVAVRYGVSDKWPWHQQKNDPRFPRGVRFSNGMTRWSAEQLDAYDNTLAEEK
jgi:predicted DNA-binding transcriptional regulator AlpA|tara:strand:- start:195 stop:383 length:189 start_codon:yes stop_codon:yes gene_type:complete